MESTVSQPSFSVMTIRVLYFASLTDLVGLASEVRDIPEGSSIRDLLEDLERGHPLLKRFERRFRIAVNQSFVDEDAVIPDGAEVALIPPVSGG